MGSASPTPLSPLHVEGREIVDAQRNPVRLRGIAIGGWMNMENFINGYPGAEHSLRKVMAGTLGERTGAFFFDRLLDHYLTEDDIAFIMDLGANAVRLAFNYRHFEDDDRPFLYKEEGFQRMDRAIEWCERQGVYAILDFHAVQGWQNPDWHSDNRHKHAMLWHTPHFQDRMIGLWQELAQRYRNNPTVAAYDLMNEPETRDVMGSHDWPEINAVYRRGVEAIREVDPDHIIVLEGDGFGSRFGGLDAPFAENLVYSSHDYSAACIGPGPYPGVIGPKYRDRAHILDNITKHQGVRYAQEHDVPMWIGEFGAVYNGPPGEQDDRSRALNDQIDTFEELELHWTIWTFKDVGVMGVVTLDPDSDYMQMLTKVRDTKQELGLDSWMGWLPHQALEERLQPLAQLVYDTIPEPPVSLKEMTQYIKDVALSGYAATLLQPAFAAQFKGMSEERIDDVLSAFDLARCQRNEGLIEVLKTHMAREVTSHKSQVAISGA